MERPRALKNIGKRILVVDDDDGIRDLISTRLELRGYQVELAGNAKEAQAYLSRSAPDIILMDIMMPDMNGVDLCRWVRSQPKTKQVPVIQISSLADETTI